MLIKNDNYYKKKIIVFFGTERRCGGTMSEDAS
jgi:hypothetical protein